MPYHLVDTVAGTGLSGTFSTGITRQFPAGGVNLIPHGIFGISGNLTVLKPTTAGFALVSAIPVSSPSSSTVNAIAGEQSANGFDVDVDSSGSLCLIWIGHAGSVTNMQMEVTGYWQ